MGGGEACVDTARGPPRSCQKLNVKGQRHPEPSSVQVLAPPLTCCMTVQATENGANSTSLQTEQGWVILARIRWRRLQRTPWATPGTLPLQAWRRCRRGGALRALLWAPHHHHPQDPAQDTSFRKPSLTPSTASPGLLGFPLLAGAERDGAFPPQLSGEPLVRLCTGPSAQSLLDKGWALGGVREVE